MKIGEFSRKYNVNTTTVRYYIERALLTPERKNNQYVFDEICMKEMEKIQLYKSYRLSLSEIELLFSLEKTYKAKDETAIQAIIDILSEKKRALEEERDSIDKVMEKLDESIRMWSSVRPETSREAVLGIPFYFIPYMTCPKCGRAFRLESVDISENLIIRGDLRCSCGYEANIEDGIIMCDGYMEDTPFKIFNNVDLVQSLTDEHSDNFRMLMDKTYIWMYQHISMVLKDKRFILAGPFTSNFVLRYCEDFGEDTLIIIVDPSLKKIKKMRKYMEDFDFRTVYIAGNVDNIPLKKGCVDIYIDDYSVTNSIFTYNKSIYSQVAPLLKRGGMAIGIFCDYTTAPKTLENFKKDHPDFIPSRMNLNTVRNDIISNGMKIEEVKFMGKTQESVKHFPRHVVDEQVKVMGYKAMKQRA